MNPIPDQPLPQAPCRDPDEINLLEYAYVLVKHKRLIIGLTLRHVPACDPVGRVRA
jgi:hypothetical protein